MNYTSSSDRLPLVEFEKVHLLYKVDYKTDQSLRGKFIQILKNPMEAFLSQPEVLHVLNDITFSAYKGDRIALVGKNGAGKSTLCRLLTKIYRPSKGVVKINGSVRSILDPSAIIYPDLTGRENARLMIKLNYPELGNQFEAVLEEALEFSGLGHFLDTPFRYYSNGMKTRLSLALATCLPADVFILDEVFDGADFDFRNKIADRMSRLIEKSGVVFFVSHSEEQVRQVCNKAILIHNGRIVKSGSLDDVFSVYNEFNNGQLGHDNGDI